MHIELDTRIREHHKTVHLADILDCDIALAVGLRSMLWTWAMDNLNGADGIMPEMGARGWSVVLGVTQGNALVTRDAMCDSRILTQRKEGLLLGEYVIHGWTPIAQKLYKKRAHDAQRQKEYRFRQRHAGRYGNVTGDKEKEKEKEKDIKKKEGVLEVQIPDDLSAHKESILEWLAYKKEKGSIYKPLGLKQFFGKLRNLNDISSAIAHSMGMNYSGVYDDNTRTQSGSAGRTPQRAAQQGCGLDQDALERQRAKEREMLGG